MWFYANLYIKISGWTILLAYFSFSRKAQTHAIFNSGWDRCLKFFLSSDQSLSSAIITGILGQFTFSMTIRTMASLLEHAEGSALRPFQIARTMAMMTGLKFMRSFSMAFRTSF